MNYLRLVLVIAFLSGSAAVPAAAPQAELWERWTAHEPDSSLTVNHSEWDTFLDEYVRYSDSLEMNAVPYGEVSGEDVKRLEDYIAYLEGIPVSKLSRASQKAFWINLYNAKTVSLVIEHYPIDSIREIKLSGLFTPGPWKEEILHVEGERLSLNDVEHRILRPIWNDPRIHYAVNCASMGCPDLQKRAYTPELMEEMLEEGAERYINSDRGVAYEDGVLYLSSIYDWFAEDFGGSIEGVFAHLRSYASEETREELAAYSGDLDYRYDWKLNEYTGN